MFAPNGRPGRRCLDRLGRSLRRLTDRVNALTEDEGGFRGLTENIGTTTSGGKLATGISDPCGSASGLGNDW